MSAGIPKSFWSSPFRYLKWASYEKPAIFYSVIVGAMGPVFLLTIPPLRRLAGDEKPARIPLSYPVPEGPRKIPTGYDDLVVENMRTSHQKENDAKA